MVPLSSPFSTLLPFSSILGVWMAATALNDSFFVASWKVEENQGVFVRIPGEPLAKDALQVATQQSQSYAKWTAREHNTAFSLLQKIARVWKESGVADQYLIYGKQRVGLESFTWEIIPYSKSNHTLGRFWQQFLVLWNITFGRSPLSTTHRQQQLSRYRELFKEYGVRPLELQKAVGGGDAFCQDEIIQKQQVFEGRSVRVLYNYAPIGFGGERLHFLVLPKAHKEKFTNLSLEEYEEASILSQKLICHFSASRSIQEVYLFHKTGVDAGQTVPHWHLHVVLTTSKTQDIFGKLTVLKNMVVGSSPLKTEELKHKVDALKIELASL